jgi:trans-2,3-dihydro-3-hydroxyanthranilate isomerase
MPAYNYRIINVFTDPESPNTRLTGNPLCVFEDGRGLDSATMQALAQQFNLSETVFILPSDKATARVRIFTPAFEMPFAGHPTLGSAHVVRALKGSGDSLTLEMGAGVIPVRAGGQGGDEWTLKANAPTTRAPDASKGEIAATLGLNTTDITATPLWVNTGNEQMVVPVASADAVRRCRPDPARMATQQNADNVPKFFVWAELGGGEILARFFLLKHGALMEDHGTGSAAANLGGWFVTQRAALPLKRMIQQGEPIGRPARLMLDVDAEGGIFVGGHVVDLGAGTVVV